MRGAPLFAAWLPWPPTEDQAVQLLILAVAVVAAVFAIRGDVFGRRQARLDAQQRKADVQPRLSATLRGDGWLTLDNAGGAAARYVWVGQSDTSVYSCSGPFPPHQVGLSTSAREIGASSYRTGTGTTLLVAQDVEQRWWDCRTGLLLAQPVESYLVKRMVQVGLADLTEALLALSLPSVLPPEATHL